MTNIVTKQTNSLALSEDNSDWGVPQNLSQSDIIIPKANVMQMMSKKVIDGEATFGQIRDSLNNTLLGDIMNPMPFVPFWMNKFWIEYTLDDKGKRKFLEKKAITFENENLKYKEGLIERDRVMEFYVLNANNIKNEMAEIGGGTVPLILTFRRSSLSGGKKLATQMYASNAAAGLSPAGMVSQLVVTKVTNDEGTFAVMDVKSLVQSTPEQVKSALYWFKKAKVSEIVADDSDLVAEEQTSKPVKDIESPF